MESAGLRVGGIAGCRAGGKLGDFAGFWTGKWHWESVGLLSCQPSSELTWWPLDLVNCHAPVQEDCRENDWENPKVNIKVKLMECSDTKVWEIQVFVLFISEYLWAAWCDDQPKDLENHWELIWVKTVGFPVVKWTGWFAGWFLGAILGSQLLSKLGILVGSNTIDYKTWTSAGIRYCEILGY